MRDVMKIHPNDNVAVALTDIKCGESVQTGDRVVTAAGDISRGHKIALCDITAGSDVIKYGYPIGTAKVNIGKGEHVHVHNLATALGEDLSYVYNKKSEMTLIRYCGEKAPEFFMGYERKDGRVGIRNELVIIPTVGCVNEVAERIAERCRDLVSDNIEAVYALTHPYGCSQLGDDQDNTRIILSDLILHPNFGGVLVLGLGCENSGIEVIKELLGDHDESRVRFLKCQEVSDEIEEGCRIMKELAKSANSVQRSRQPIDRLVVGLKCGGSDGLSGITANPAVGGFTDILTANGGSAILTEVPEMFGAETILMNRACDRAVFEKTVSLINDFKDYYRRNDQVIYENPSPGNKAGGISTLEDKSLGCIQKSGGSEVADVLSYGERIAKKGLNLLSAPGNDLVSSSALAASGAQLILFTTGRGTPFASPVPTVKLSTNSALFEKKRNWIDFDCGRLADGEQTLSEISSELCDLVVKIASGQKTKSEEAGYHGLAIFKQGVTL